jgi:hypothetical protein
MKQALEDYSLKCPRPSQLQLVIRLNVLNAIAQNATLIGFPIENLCRDEFTSPFHEIGPRCSNAPMPAAPCPRSLWPTYAQRTIPHHPWIDLFPFPGFRDEVLQSMQAGLIDDDELCFDLLGVECVDQSDKPALIVWTEAWNPHCWEVSEAFLRKWGIFVASCPELIESTNYWRTRRGQKRLTGDMLIA